MRLAEIYTHTKSIRFPDILSEQNQAAIDFVLSEDRESNFHVRVLLHGRRNEFTDGLANEEPIRNELHILHLKIRLFKFPLRQDSKKD